MPHQFPTRRGFLASSALAGAALPLANAAFGQSQPESGSGFQYEVTRSESEWRELLTDEEYEILRDGGTEFPTSHPLWNDWAEGEFHCKGCDLHLYTSEWRANILLGWVFFFHAIPDAVLTAIDTAEGYPNGDPNKTLIEVHCRRCGSHLGHIVDVEDQLVHCINGTSLERRETTA